MIFDCYFLFAYPFAAQLAIMYWCLKFDFYQRRTHQLSFVACFKLNLALAITWTYYHLGLQSLKLATTQTSDHSEFGASGDPSDLLESAEVRRSTHCDRHTGRRESNRAATNET